MMTIKNNPRNNRRKQYAAWVFFFAAIFNPLAFAETAKDSETSTADVSVSAPVTTPVTTSTSSASSNVLFILDASGSMWGEIDGKPKINIAKDVMTNLVKELPANIKTGLEVYGHRKKGDCDDIEILANIGEKTNKDLIQQLNSIQPKGKTPLTASLETAADVLKSYEEASSVVLISDGKETCDADPCATVKQLREQGINVKVHVVGFDVKNDEKAQLNCIAEAGGGKYFNAENAAELKTALSEVKKEVEQSKPEPAEPIKEATAETTEKVEEKPKSSMAYNGKIKLKTIFAENTDPITSNLAYNVYKAEKNLEGKQEKVTYSYDAEPTLTLEDGKYLITVKYGGNESYAKGSLEIDTKTLESNELVINLNAGFLKVSAIPKAGADPLTEGLAYNIFQTTQSLEGKQQKVAFSYHANPRFILPDGKYSLTVKYGGNGSNVYSSVKDLVVKAGQMTEQTIDLNFGILKLSSVLKDGQEALNQHLAYQVYNAEKNLEGKRKKAAFSYGAQPKFKLTTGKYYLEISHGGNESNVRRTLESIEVPAGVMTEQNIVLDAGYIDVSTTLNGELIKDGLNYQVTEKQANIEGKRKKVAFSYGAKPLFRLTTGEYRITVQYGDKSKTVEVNVKAGEKIPVSIEL